MTDLIPLLLLLIVGGGLGLFLFKVTPTRLRSRQNSPRPADALEPKQTLGGAAAGSNSDSQPQSKKVPTPCGVIEPQPISLTPKSRRKETPPKSDKPSFSPTILVRNRYWKNTAEAAPKVRDEQAAAPVSSVDGLIKELARENRTEARRSAAEALGQLGTSAREAIPALLRSAVDVDPSVREAALGALKAIDPAWSQNGDVAKAIPFLVAALGGRHSNVRDAAARLLIGIGQPAVSTVTQTLSEAKDAGNEVYLIRVLGRMGPTSASAVSELDRALKSQFPQVRVAAADALAGIGQPAETVVPTLIKGLTDSYADVRQAMANCLARLGQAAEPATPELLRLLADQNDDVRKAAVDALEGIGPKVVPSLAEIVQTRDIEWRKALSESNRQTWDWFVHLKRDSVRMAPLETLNNLFWKQMELLNDRESLEAAHEAALRLLGKLGPTAAAAAPAVAQTLANSNPGIRLAAVGALGQFGREASGVVPEIIQRLTDTSKSVREAAAEALAKIDSNWASDSIVGGSVAGLLKSLSSAGRSAEVVLQALVLAGPGAVPALIEALESEDRIVREQAAIALGRIGTGAKAAIPALTRALKDSHGWVQEAAANALAKIKS